MNGRAANGHQLKWHNQLPQNLVLVRKSTGLSLIRNPPLPRDAAIGSRGFRL